MVSGSLFCDPLLGLQLFFSWTRSIHFWVDAKWLLPEVSLFVPDRNGRKLEQ